MGMIKEDFMAELLYWTSLDCTGVPDKVATEHIYTYISIVVKC